LTRDDSTSRLWPPRGSVRGACRPPPIPARARAQGPNQDLERRTSSDVPRPTRRRRMPRDGYGVRVEITGPTLASDHGSPGPATACSKPEDATPRNRPRCFERHFTKRDEGGPHQSKAELTEDGSPSRQATSAMPITGRTVRRGLCPTRSSTSPKRCATRLHERLVKALAPGGYLVVGTSERVADRAGAATSRSTHLSEVLRRF